MDMSSTMTHYMELLATNQPWNLIIFMAIPVIFAEFIAVTELYILLGRGQDKKLRHWNKIAGIVIGIYFTGVFFYLLFNAVIPLTTGGGWRGIADVIAVGFYLLGIVPLGGLALMGLGIIGKQDARTAVGGFVERWNIRHFRTPGRRLSLRKHATS